MGVSLLKFLAERSALYLKTSYLELSQAGEYVEGKVGHTEGHLT